MLVSKIHSGNKSLKDEGGHVRDSMICNEKLKALIKAYPRTTVPELAAKLGVCFKIVSNHLKVIV